MVLARSEEELAVAGPGTGPVAEPDVPAAGLPNPAPLPAVPGLVMLVGAEDAQVCSDGTCL